jgi:hypothetical protein
VGGARAPRQKNKIKKKDDPTILLKTKEEQEDILDDPTMFIKTNDLFL